MKNVANFFIVNHKLTIVLSVGLFIYGIMGLSRMNSESFPNVNFAMATVVTPYDGASAEDIETKITKKLEDEIRGVSGLKDVRSISQAGLSSIFIRVDMDDSSVDIDETMNDIQKAIDRVTDLPRDLTEQPKFTEINSEEFPVFEIAVIGSNENRHRDAVADLLKEEFEDNKKVKEVRLTGFAERRFQIRLDRQKMARNHIGVNEVLSKIQTRNVNIPGGSLKDSQTQTLVRLEGQIKNKEELDQIIVRSNFSGQEIFLKDIATVEDSEDEIQVTTLYNGKPATLVIVNKKGGSDTIELVTDANQRLEKFKELYPDLRFEIYHNEARNVQDRLDILAGNAVSGLALVVVFLLIFLPGRIGLMASLSLPLAVMATLGLMPAFGMNLNTITILALVIALGMMVDNSVVIAENYTRLRQEGKNSLEAATQSIDQLWLPITATAFTTIAAFMPMLVTKGIMGQFIKWIPIVVSLSLIFSLLESFLFLPMRIVKIGSNVKVKDGENDHHDWFSRLEEKFERLTGWMVRKRYLVLVMFGGLVFGSIFLMVVANKFILFPAEQTEIYLARMKLSQGTRLEVTEKAVEKVSVAMKEALGEDALHIVGRAGSSKAEFNDPKGAEGASNGLIFLYVSEHAKFNVDYTVILDKLRSNIKAADFGLEDISFDAMINGPPVGNDIEVTFRSNDMKALTEMINTVETELAQIEGITNLRIDDVFGDDQVFVDVNYEKADRLGLDVQTIGSTIRTAVSGTIVSTVNLNNKDVDLIVRFQEPYRTTKKDLESITVMDRMGNLVPISSVANFRVAPPAVEIKRFDFKRAKTLTGTVDGVKMTSIVANQKLSEIYQRLASASPSVSLTYGGAAESTKESMDSLYNALVLSLIGIFALLVFLFRSYLRPAIIMSTIPLGLFGFAVSFWLHDRPISFMALIGIIGLGGIIVNSGIVLISFIDDMRAEGKLPLEQILAKSSRLRLRAVFVTSLTTIGGLLPTAYGIGGSDAILIPMTMAMAWGLTSGTILTLVWVPCAYAILEDWTSLMSRLGARIAKLFKKDEPLITRAESYGGK